MVGGYNTENWIGLISARLGSKLKVTERQVGVFAMALEKVIPQMIGIGHLKNPNRDLVRQAKQKADELMRVLDDIKELSSKSPYLTDIIDFSLAARLHPIDFHDIYWFADALQGFLNDKADGFKAGRDSSNDLLICQSICQIYHQSLGLKPACYDQDRIKESGDIEDGTPYERVCLAVSERYAIKLSWSSMKKATKTYHALFAKSTSIRLDG